MPQNFYFASLKTIAVHNENFYKDSLFVKIQSMSMSLQNNTFSTTPHKFLLRLHKILLTYIYMPQKFYFVSLKICTVRYEKYCVTGTVRKQKARVTRVKIEAMMVPIYSRRGCFWVPILICNSRVIIYKRKTMSSEKRKYSVMRNSALIFHKKTRQMAGFSVEN